MQVISLLLAVFVATSMGQGDNTNTTSNTDNGSTPKPGDSPKSRSTNFGFDCRRSAGSCNNNKSCDLNTGKCNCGAGAFSYNCADISPDSSCSTLCLNGGTCNAGKCVCTENFYGTNCNLTRVQVLCKGQAMFVNINPIGTFSGNIYVPGNHSCNFNLPNTSRDAAKDFQPELANYPGLEGQWKVLTFTGPECGDADVEDNGQGTAYVFKIYVQYMRLFKSAVDQIVLAQCVVTNGTLNVSSSEVSGVTDATDNLDQVDADGKIDAVSLKVLDSDKKSAAKSVFLGDVINLLFAMPVTNGSAYTDFRLEVCTANNTLNGQDLKTLIILRNGCPSEEARSIFAGMPEKNITETSVVMDLKLKAFMFVGGSQFLGFTCTVALCTKEKPGDCALPTTCPGFSSATGQISPDPGSSNSSATPQATRRKRDIASATKEDKVEATTVRVEAPGQQQDTGTPSDASKEPEATQKPEGQPKAETCAVDKFVAAVAILGACVFLLLLLSGCLIFWLMMSKKSDPGRPDYYPRPVEGVRFPRLELNAHDNAF